MSRAWRIMGIIVLVIFVAGIVSTGIGLLTGASADRMAENIFGGWEALETMINVILGELDGILPGQHSVTILG